VLLQFDSMSDKMREGNYVSMSKVGTSLAKNLPEKQ